MKLTSKQQLRLNILSKYISGELYYLDAIKSLDVSERQFRRLVKSFKEDGIKSMLHGNCGRTPSNKMNEVQRTKIVRLYQTVYRGMNVVHFIEKLTEVERMKVPAYSTVRKILLEENLITPSMKRKKRNYPRRVRYEKEGLMVQIDGSHHRWIYGHPMFCLTAAIDDATGKVLGAKFTKTETTFAAMDVVEEAIKKHGVFQMLYSDRAGIYGGKRQGYSNMNRAMSELGIVPIQAFSPQAKGRVERLFKTLQSRLVHEMRLAGVSNMDEANKFLKLYLPIFNKKFGRQAASSESGFRELDKSINLDELFTMQWQRKVQRGELISFSSEQFLLEEKESFEGANAEIKQYRDGRYEIFIYGRKVKYKIFREVKRAA